MAISASICTAVPPCCDGVNPVNTTYRTTAVSPFFFRCRIRNVLGRRCRSLLRLVITFACFFFFYLLSFSLLLLFMSFFSLFFPFPPNFFFFLDIIFIAEAAGTPSASRGAQRFWEPGGWWRRFPEVFASRSRPRLTGIDCAVMHRRKVFLLTVR